MDAFVKRKWKKDSNSFRSNMAPSPDYYLSSSLEPADYPDLIAKDQHIATIAVPTILAAYNRRPDSPRYGRVARFVDRLFGSIDKLRSPQFHPKWRT